jgi:hypothetical protein
VPDAGATIQPVEASKVRCPRCWFPAHFIAIGALVFRCARCEWLFTLAAPTITAPASGSPVSGTVYANTTGTVVAVTFATTTGVTGINVNGTSTGQTSGTVLVPVGGNVSVAWATTQPTWTWALPTTSAAVSAGGTALPLAAGGTAFAQNQVLIVDPAGTSDVVGVNGTPTGTSVPVDSLNSAHNSGVSITVAQPAPRFPALQSVPPTTY